MEDVTHVALEEKHELWTRRLEGMMMLLGLISPIKSLVLKLEKTPLPQTYQMVLLFY